MRYERPVCTVPCSRNASYSRQCRSSRSVIVVDRSFGRAGRQLRPSKDHSCSLAVARFGTSCCTHTCHRTDRFFDSDHRHDRADSDHLVCNHGHVCNHDLVANQDTDTAPGQYCSRLSRFRERQRVPVRTHLFFYSSNSLVLIPPLRNLMATAMPLRESAKEPRFYCRYLQRRPKSTRYRALINRHRD